jgi:hypothetical protein
MPSDYVCVNMGNSRQRLLNDAQMHMEEYMRTQKRLQLLYQVFEVEQSMEVQVVETIGSRESHR